MRAPTFAGLLAATVAVAAAAPASAQPSLGTTRVATESATVYARCDASSPARVVVKRGTLVTIEVVNEGWVSVRVDSLGERGCVRRAELEPTAAIDRAGDAGRAREIDRARGVSRRGPALPSPTGRALRVSAYGSAGLFSATAKDSFEAILETRSGIDLGAGVQIAWQTGPLRGLFVEGDLSRFEETGERAFVDGRDVFRLGIPLTLTLTPIEISAGYRVAATHRGRDGRVVASPIGYYAGGGIGTVRYREADDDAQVTDSFTAYHVMGGAEVRVWGPLHVGAEARYRWVPDGLGAAGVSAAFEETDLGGSTIRVRIGVAF
jgi:hypothetical protein